MTYAHRSFARTVAEHAKRTINVESAGFNGPGRSPPDDALEATTSQVIDVAHRLSKLVAHQVVENADLIVVMNSEQRARS